MKKLLIFPLLLLSLTLYSCELKNDEPLTIDTSESYYSEWAVQPISNQDKVLLDNNWEITRAIILFNGESIEIDVENWKDCGNSGIKIRSTDGKVYITHLNNVLLFGE